MTPAIFLKLITSGTGTTWVAAPSSAPVTVLHVLNDTGTTIEFRRSGDTGNTFQLPTSMAWSFRGLTNSSQLQFRRADTSNTPVTAWGEAELENRAP